MGTDMVELPFMDRCAGVDATGKAMQPPSRQKPYGFLIRRGKRGAARIYRAALGYEGKKFGPEPCSRIFALLHGVLVHIIVTSLTARRVHPSKRFGASLETRWFHEVVIWLRRR